MTKPTTSSIWIHNRAVERGYLEINNKKFSIAGLIFPHDVRAERAVLASILQAGMTGETDDVMSELALLQSEDFHIWSNGIIYRAMLRLQKMQRPIDIVTLTHFLSDAKDPQNPRQSVLEMIGGDVFLGDMVRESFGSHLSHYADLLRQQAVHRVMLFEIEQLRQDVQKGTSSELLKMMDVMSKVTERAQERVFSLHANNGSKLSEDLPSHLQKVYHEQMNPETLEYMTTGFESLDAYLHGWSKRRLYLVGGSNGMGKSAFLLSSGLAALRAGKKVCFVSLELSQQELLERIACNIAAIDSRRMAKRDMTAQELGRFKPLVDELTTLASKGAQMRLVCLPYKPTLAQFEAEIEKVKQTGGFDLLIIDYVGWGRFSETDPNFKNGNTVSFTGAIFNCVDRLKVRYDCPVVVAVQINRDHEKNADKRPELRNIADSKIGGDNADVVLFVHRPDRYDLSETPNRSELIIRKNRYGEEGVAVIRAELQYNRFTAWQDGQGVDSGDL